MAVTKPQFLLLGLSEKARVGGNVRVLGTAADEKDAEAVLDALDPSVLGLIVLVEVKQQYERRPTVQSTPTDSPLFSTDK
jgi:hypothetical protein